MNKEDFTLSHLKKRVRSILSIDEESSEKPGKILLVKPDPKRLEIATGFNAKQRELQIASFMEELTHHPDQSGGLFTPLIVIDSDPQKATRHAFNAGVITAAWVDARWNNGKPYIPSGRPGEEQAYQEAYRIAESSYHLLLGKARRDNRPLAEGLSLAYQDLVAKAGLNRSSWMVPTAIHSALSLKLTPDKLDRSEEYHPGLDRTLALRQQQQVDVAIGCGIYFLTKAKYETGLLQRSGLPMNRVSEPRG